MSIVSRNSITRDRRVGSRFFTLLLCSLIVLAGCGNGESGEEGHQFATDREPTKVATEAIAATPTNAESALPTAVPTLAVADFLSVRGAPQIAYFVIDGELQVYDAATRDFTPVNIPAEMTVLDFTTSPTGDRAGVLGLLENRVVVQFFGADGEPLGDAVTLSIGYAPMQDSPAASPVASPTASPVATPRVSTTPPDFYLTWVPQGNAVVVAGPGVLQRVSMSGEVMPISRTGVTGSVTKALWSPMDSQVVILTQLMDGHQGVFMLQSGTAEAQELEALHLQPGQSLNNLQWLPTGLGLVFVVGENRDGELMNGQLYSYQFGDPTPTLVATSGQGGPAGTITHAVVSPDGQSVAYAVMVRDQETWHLHSLWVKPVSGGASLSIPTNSNAPLVSLLWTSEGLAWQQEDGTLTVIDTALDPRPLGEAPQATPVASPVSTPVLEATPRG